MHQRDPSSLLSSLETKFLQMKYMDSLFQLISIKCYKIQDLQSLPVRRQVQDRLTDPRTTRLAGLQAAKRETGQGTLGNLYNEGICQIVPPVIDAQGIFTNGERLEHVAYGVRPKFFPHSLSVLPPNILESQFGGVVQHLLETGVTVDDDALYNSNINDVDYTLKPL